MDRSARIRWSILLSALAATLVAIWYPVDQDGTQTVQPAAPRPPKTAAVASVGTPAARGVWEPLLADPFAPRHWDAAPAPVTPVAVQAPPVVVEAPAAPVGPPALPFQFVGQMSDSADKVVYLSRGESALIARVGDVLEGSYKVLDITPLQIEFEHLPTGQKQALPFPSRNN
jgi:hypothetical protein